MPCPTFMPGLGGGNWSRLISPCFSCDEGFGVELVENTVPLQLEAAGPREVCCDCMMFSVSSVCYHLLLCRS